MTLSPVAAGASGLAVLLGGVHVVPQPLRADNAHRLHISYALAGRVAVHRYQVS